MSQISILGCGWLGLPLAKSLTEKGFKVKGSTTSSGKLPFLQSNGINGFLIMLSENGISGDIDSFLENSEILIIDIPPKLRANLNENFVMKMENLIPFLSKSGVKKVVFISSTSVYGNDCLTVTETTKPNPDTEGGKQLLLVEELLFENLNFATTVIRFGGLIGDDRHPVHYLSGKDNIESPNAPINLIHQIDCIGIIEKIIELDYWNQTFNAVAPFHPNRKEYYTQKAIEFGLELPQFKEDQNSDGKIILNNLVESELKYLFKKPNL